MRTALFAALVLIIAGCGTSEDEAQVLTPAETPPPSTTAPSNDPAAANPADGTGPTAEEGTTAPPPNADLTSPLGTWSSHGAMLDVLENGNFSLRVPGAGVVNGTWTFKEGSLTLVPKQLNGKPATPEDLPRTLSLTQGGMQLEGDGLHFHRES